MSELGKKDVHNNVSKSLQHEGFDFIITSSMQRAVQTSEIVRQFHPNSKIVLCDDLIERGYGNLEGLPSSLMYEFEKLETEGLIEKYDGYNRLKVESWQDFTSRVSKALDVIKNNIKNVKVLVIAHGRVFNALCYLIGAEQILQLKHNNIVIFEEKNNGWTYK